MFRQTLFAFAVVIVVTVAVAIVRVVVSPKSDPTLSTYRSPLSGIIVSSSDYGELVRRDTEEIVSALDKKGIVLVFLAEGDAPELGKGSLSRSEAERLKQYAGLSLTPTDYIPAWSFEFRDGKLDPLPFYRSPKIIIRTLPIDPNLKLSLLHDFALHMFISKAYRGSFEGVGVHPSHRNGYRLAEDNAKLKKLWTELEACNRRLHPCKELASLTEREARLRFVQLTSRLRYNYEFYLRKAEAYLFQLDAATVLGDQIAVRSLREHFRDITEGSKDTTRNLCNPETERRSSRGAKPKAFANERSAYQTQCRRIRELYDGVARQLSAIRERVDINGWTSGV